MAKRQKLFRWEDSAVIPQETNWFPEDMRGSKSKPSLDSIFFVLSSNAQVDIFQTMNGVTKKFKVNEGNNIKANEPFTHQITVYPGMSYNFQHRSQDQNVAYNIITEVVS